MARGVFRKTRYFTPIYRRMRRLSSTPAVAPTGRIMSSLANGGGLAGKGGIAGPKGGLAG